MLVLTRKEKQRIVFPSVNISIEISKIAGNTARVAVEAPRGIRILRGELDDGTEEPNVVVPRELLHRYRNQAHVAQMSLMILQKELQGSSLERAENAAKTAIEALQALESTLISDPAAPKTESPSHSLRALLVEDNDSERELLKGYLELSGYDVESAPDGLAALRYLMSHNQPDFVILDMQMPKMDGSQLVEAIRGEPGLKDLRLFALSGMDQEDCPIPIGRDGINRWFRKPIRPDFLAAELGKEVVSSL